MIFVCVNFVLLVLILGGGAEPTWGREKEAIGLAFVKLLCYFNGFLFLCVLNALFPTLWKVWWAERQVDFCFKERRIIAHFSPPTPPAIP